MGLARCSCSRARGVNRGATCIQRGGRVGMYQPGFAGVLKSQPACVARCMSWPVRGFPLAPYLVSFPCFLLVSLQHPLVSSGNPGETPWNSSFWGGSEPCLRLFWGQNRQNTGYFAGIPGNPRYTWKIPGYRADFLNFAPDFAPDQLSDSGKLASFPRETREKQNGAPNTLWFPWKLPETQSAGDPLVSLWVAGNPCTGQLSGTISIHLTTHLRGLASGRAAGQG